MRRNPYIVPSVMFHSVGMEQRPWIWNHISEPLNAFEAKIKALHQKKFNTLNWNELYRYMNGEVRLPKNSIFLTFDDGYLDNWTLVFPILKKYNIRATIFVNPEFVDPRSIVRLSLDDVWAGGALIEEVEVAGFLSWDEMRLMESSGLVNIQSHSLTHTWFFSGPKIVDYHKKEVVPKYPWLFWNAKPERKPFYLNEDQNDFIPIGYPILEHEKSLVVRRFTPDQEAMHLTNKYICSQNIEEFSLDQNWRKKVNAFVEDTLNGLGGQYETNSEYEERIFNELKNSKDIIENKLNKKVEFICWPGGGNSKVVQSLAEKSGYKSWTLGSKDKTNKKNDFDVGGKEIKRIASGHEFKFRGKKYSAGAVYFMLLIYTHQNSLVSRLFSRLYIVSSYLFQGLFKRLDNKHVR